MDNNVVIDRCTHCGAAILWNEDLGKRVITCSCCERNPNCCSDGACEGMCHIELDN